MKKKRTLLVLAAIIGSVMLLAGCGGGDKKGSGEKKVLNIYSWADYYAPEIIADFEKKYNCKVTYDVYSNNEELLAKMQAGGAQFDIIQPSDYMVTTMIKLDMLEKLDKSKIPNAANIAKNLQHPAYDPNEDYSLAYVWGMTGIVYNTKYVKTAPTSWADLWKPEYKGHLLLLNDCREVFSMALKKNGHSNNSTNTDEINQAFQDLKTLNNNVLAYDTENNKQKMIAEEAWIGLMWSGDAAYCYTDNKSIAFAIPKEGTLIWADNMAIPKGCKNKELAEAFINYMYDPDVSAKNFNYIRLPNPNEKAWPKMNAATLNNPMLKVANDSITKGEWLHDIGNAITTYDKYWTELKTGK
jgi:spermidine/putrescine transport system substrate-binding protein